MANETHKGEGVAKLEASFGEVIQKQDWIQCVNDQLPFRCLIKAKKCPYNPFKFRFRLNDHMRKTHHMIFSKAKSCPNVTSAITKD